MPKAPKHDYYAVRTGRRPGIYLSWAECEAQIKGVANAVYKKLQTEAEAIEFMAAGRSTVRTSTSHGIVVAPSSRPTFAPKSDDARTIAIEATPHENDCDIVYCDGACKGNGRSGSIAGIGVWWGHGDPRNISERCPGDQTNNRAELIAIVRILETTPRLRRRLLIKTDSHYSIQCVTSWIFRWIRNGFLTVDGKPVKNHALIKYLAALLYARRKTSQAVEFKHVRGHVGIEGNEAADRLANLGATKPMVPEREWEELEKQVLQGLEPAKPVGVADDDLVEVACASDFLSDDELAELAGTSITNDMMLVRQSKRQHPQGGKHATGTCTSVPVLYDISPPPANASTVAPRSNDGIISLRSRSKLPSGGSPKLSPNVAQGLQSVSAKKPAAVVGKEELEAYASCLLSNDEWSTFGKDGVFNSDF